MKTTDQSKQKQFEKALTHEFKIGDRVSWGADFYTEKKGWHRVSEYGKICWLDPIFGGIVRIEAGCGVKIFKHERELTPCKRRKK